MGAFLVAAVLCAALFVVVERRARSPILPRQLFAGRAFLPAVGYGMVMNFTYYGSIFMLSIFLQDSLGYSPMRAGVAFLPLTAGFFISNVVSGPFVARFGARLPMLVGSCIDALGFALLLRVTTHSAYADLALGFLLIPMGMGLGVPAMTGAVLAAVPDRLSATASALLNTARQACGAVGVAVLGAWAQGGPERIAGSIRRAALLCIAAAGGSVRPRVARRPACDARRQPAAWGAQLMNPFSIPECLSGSANLLGEPARLSILWALLDRRAYTAGELAVVADLSAPSASMHLAKLLEANWVGVARRGRHRYYTIADDAVAHAVEAIGAIRFAGRPRRSPLRPQPDERLQRARSCYGHLAGAVAVSFWNALLERHWVRRDGRRFALSTAGASGLARFLQCGRDDAARTRV